ncbi:hypothetical protein JP75_09655 [Devosia riboflavina]|uniref:Uncharacterized protein n=1 Tax=Devosia riboflavina TaxID=46914 RepID=A0A087M2Q3_9HYPH|nr:hypothetical protein [Devosia riboflavina]KFL31156.1 hypothetical protein JP75_09655 [Devosia riboflavina]
MAATADKRGALRGYLLAQAVTTKNEHFSSEDIFDAFSEDYDDFADFDEDFVLSLTWLGNQGLISFDALPLGANGESTVIGLTATAVGKRAVGAAENLKLQVPSGPPKRKGFAVEVAKVFGAFVGEFVNTQK